MRHPLESDNTEFTSVLSHPIKYRRYFMGPKKSGAGQEVFYGSEKERSGTGSILWVK